MDKTSNRIEAVKTSMTREALLTVGDFIDMKDQFLTEIRKILKSPGSNVGQKWLKAFEVRKLLKISAGKLQYLRDKGEIPFTKLGGVTYYDADKIDKMMEG